MKILFVFIILFVAVIVCFSQTASIRRRSTDEFIGKEMNKSRIVGLAAAIIINDSLIWSKGYGYADKAAEVPFTSSTIINIASISKTITATCLMKAVELGKVSLDKDINVYLPFKLINPYRPAAIITLRNLATHTSGIIDQEAYVNAYHFGADATESLDYFIRNYFQEDGKYYKKENFLDKDPGKVYEYSNIGAALIGYIVEIVTNEPLSKFSKEVVFDPLKMYDTGWFLSEVDLRKHSKLYYLGKDSVYLIDFYGLTTYPDGGVRTSVDDLAKFMICVVKGGTSENVTIVNKESVKEMVRAQFPRFHKPHHLKLKRENQGVLWSVERKGKKIGHDGEDPGVNTEMFYDYSNRIGVILFMNVSTEEGHIKALSSISTRLWNDAQRIRKHN